MRGGLWKWIAAVSCPFLVLVLAVGCSEKELDTAKTELKACREKQQSLKQEADSCRQELAGQKQRWDNIQETLASAVPADVIEGQRVIIQSLPAPVRMNVQKELDKYFVAVAREFQSLHRQNDELLQGLRSTGRQVARTSKQVDEVKTVADQIQEGVQAAGQCAEQRDQIQTLNEQIQARNRLLSSKVEQTIATILTFDRGQVNCKGCEGRIMMFPKGKERILKFHSSLVSDLTSFQSSLSAPEAP